MKSKKLEINYEELRFEELNSEDQSLIEAAIKATDNSYADYSHFHVGAAVRLSDSTIVIGANQENAAFPSGLCAERTAIFAAQAQYPKLAVEALAIAAKNSDGILSQPVTPCGSCRQVVLQIEERYHHPVEILLYGSQRIFRFHSIRDLLPFCFVDDSMKS